MKSQSSESDSEEEHDIDPSIHDSPMFTSLPSSHSNTDSKDHSVDEKVDDMFITASGRFIAPTSTLPRMRRSMNSVGVSPLLLSSTPDSPSVSAALACKRFRLVSKSTEVYSDDETQSTGADDEEAMLHTQDDLSTSSLPCTPLKVCMFIMSVFTYVTIVVNYWVCKDQPRRCKNLSIFLSLLYYNL